MTDWKPGQKLEGPNGERAIWLGRNRYGHASNAAFLTGGADWHSDAIRGGRWTPVDEWSDPVAEARERVWSAIVRQWNRPTTLSAFLSECAADLRVLLDAEEAK